MSQDAATWWKDATEDHLTVYASESASNHSSLKDVVSSQDEVPLMTNEAFADVVDSSAPLAPSFVAPAPLPRSSLGDSALVVVLQ